MALRLFRYSATVLLLVLCLTGCQSGPVEITTSEVLFNDPAIEELCTCAGPSGQEALIWGWDMTGSGSNLVGVDLASREQSIVFPDISVFNFDLAWTSDGRFIAVDCYGCPDLSILNRDSGEILTRIPDTHEAAWSTDSRYLAVQPFGKEVLRILETQTWEIVVDLPKRNTLNLGTAWSPQGSYVASVDNRSLYIWDTVEWQEKILIRTTTHLFNYLAWSPDEQYIAASTYDGITRVFDVETGDLVYEFVPDGFITTGVGSALAWSPDGRYLAAGSVVAGSSDLLAGLIYILDSETGQPEYVLSGHTSVIYCIDWVADQHSLVSSSYDHTVRLWNLDAR